MAGSRSLAPDHVIVNVSVGQQGVGVEVCSGMSCMIVFGGPKCYLSMPLIGMSACRLQGNGFLQ